MLELVVAGSKFNCVIVAAAALAVGSPSTVATDDISQFRGSGIYRPFNLMRQIKLTVGYFDFLDPSLPDKVHLAYAYRLGDVIRNDWTVENVADALESGKMRLAVPVDQSSGYLTPIAAPCRIQGDARQSLEAVDCANWLNALREERPEALREFQVLLDKEIGVPGSVRMVTWDPNEIVEGQCNLPLSSEALQLR